MGVKSTSLKGGAGFLNGVDGAIVGYRWVPTFNGGPSEGPNENGFERLFLKVSALVDGASEPVETTLDAGGTKDGLKISKDGLTVTPSSAVWGKKPAGRFILTLQEPTDGGDGFPADRFTDDHDANNDLRPMIGSRVRFGQEAELGQDNKPKMREGKGEYAGKQFPITNAVVASFLAAPAPGAKGVAKPAARVAKPAAAAGKQQAPAATDTKVDGDITTDVASAALLAMLKKASPIAPEGLNAAVSKYALNQGYSAAQRDALKAIIFDADFQKLEAGWVVADSGAIAAA